MIQQLPKKLLLLATSFIFHHGFSQTKDLQLMLQTEYDFIKLARDKSTRTAFLTYLTDETVTFAGNKVVKGRTKFEAMSEDESLLIWEPDFADISGSGDFGYDTGPASYRKHKSDEKPLSYGSFVSVWKKQPDGNWKLALDIGIYPQPAVEKVILKTSSFPLKKSSISTTNRKDELIHAELEFLEKLPAIGISAYEPFVSKEWRFYRIEKSPSTTPNAVKDLLHWQNKNQKMEYTFIDGESALSGDLGYVYGSVIIKSSEGSAKISNASYVRIWKKEDGVNWKIVVDIIAD